MISIRNISKSYGHTPVLRDISLDIPSRKITALVGGNGAGKSTLLSVISRLIKPDTGRIEIAGKDITAYKSQLLAQQLSILKQSNHLNLQLTVRELVGFGRFPYSQGRLTPADHAVIDEAIAFLDLTGIQHRYLGELSGGQQQRAFLAMIVAQDTSCILLDEPLNNLDMKHSVQIMKTLRRLCDERGKTIVMVIHEINFAAAYADYIAVLKEESLQYFDQTGNIIDAGILKKVFDLEFDIILTKGKKFCNYFD
ncbi:MAG: ATP-binding cassette domain-containing protein [Flavihumibacter sp.]